MQYQRSRSIQCLVYDSKCRVGTRGTELSGQLGYRRQADYTLSEPQYAIPFVARGFRIFIGADSMPLSQFY